VFIFEITERRRKKKKEKNLALHQLVFRFLEFVHDLFNLCLPDLPLSNESVGFLGKLSVFTEAGHKKEKKM